MHQLLLVELRPTTRRSLSSALERRLKGVAKDERMSLEAHIARASTRLEAWLSVR